jgi:TonB family protein
VEIEATGSVARVTVLDETGRWGFGAAAQRAYAAARFTPPRIAGRPVRVVLRKTIEFEP